MGRRRRNLPASIVLPPRWRRHFGILITVLAIAGAVVLERSGWSPVAKSHDVVRADSLNPDDTARYHDKIFAVVHVVDGDTLDIDAPDPGNGKSKTRIRLWGVDCPEIAHGGSGAMHFGPQATAFAKETLTGNVQVVLSPRQTRDRYGRLLAYVFLEPGGAMFNEMLIEEGFAYADPRFDHHYETRFAAAERRARERKAGLWAGVQLADMPKWRQKREKKHPAPQLAIDADDSTP
jgi:endonuclease YncB( thermonuclease family)